MRWNITTANARGAVSEATIEAPTYDLAAVEAMKRGQVLLIRAEVAPPLPSPARVQAPPLTPEEERQKRVIAGAITSALWKWLGIVLGLSILLGLIAVGLSKSR